MGFQLENQSILQNTAVLLKNLSSQDLHVDFRANFDEDKAKFRRLAAASQVILSQSSSKFAEKTRAIDCEDRFLYCITDYVNVDNRL